jgi:hypothetical protein
VGITQVMGNHPIYLVCAFKSARGDADESQRTHRGGWSMADSYSMGQQYERPRHKGLKTLAILTTLMAITILPALAARGGSGKGHGGNGGGSTSGSTGLAWKMVTDADGNGSPNYKDQLTFDVAPTTATTRPMVALTCSQDGVHVYSMTAGFYPDYPWTTTYTLSSTRWTGGAADCTATLYYIAGNGKEPVLGSIAVPVGA